ncbi:MAG: hypothetical protein NZ781_10635 [Armatimonadetes bacterium]|nr:hypothetical protein [Armatimonadota bacterium]
MGRKGHRTFKPTVASRRFQAGVVSGKNERRQNNLAQKQITLMGDLTLAFRRPINLEGSKRRNRPTLSDRLSFVPTSFSRFSPLTLNGATALAFAKVQPDRLCVNYLERCLAFDENSSMPTNCKISGATFNLTMN